MTSAQTLSVEEVEASLPENYSFIKYLNEGGYGQVVKCQTKDTHQDVAIKLPYYEQTTEDEISLLAWFAEAGFDQRNIVKFLGAFDTRLGKAMIFELLDTSLYEYVTEYGPLPLSDVSTITRQVATALEVLKHWCIMHLDIKAENVMIVDHTQRPLQVKLIDFGLARPASRDYCIQGLAFHIVRYRPPEIILGLPWNEAVDVWCLGTMFAVMYFHLNLFPNTTPYEVLKVMVHLFGAPPDDVLSLGIRTKKYFNWTDDTWILKTSNKRDQYYTEWFSSLHSLAEHRLSRRSNQEDPLQVEAATDLLSQMLTMDVSARITPSQILQHPFICPERPMTEVVPQDQPDLAQQTTVSEPGVIVVKPAKVESIGPLKEEDQQTEGHVAEAVPQEQPDLVQQTSVSEPVVIVVKPAAAENTNPLKEDLKDRQLAVHKKAVRTFPVLEQTVTGRSMLFHFLPLQVPQCCRRR